MTGDTAFDSVMMQLARELGLELPNLDRGRKLYENYRSQLDHWSGDAQAETAKALSDDINALVAVQDADDPGIGLEEAEQRFNDALAVEPENPQVLNSYAIFLLTRANKPDEAEEQFRKALAAEPDDPAILANYAKFLYEFRGRIEEAESLLSRAVELNPADSTTLANLAEVVADDDADRADTLYEQATMIDPFDPLLLGNYAIFQQHRVGDLDKADSLFRRALEAAPLGANNLANYSQLLFWKNHSRDATLVLDRAWDSPELSDEVRLELSFYEFCYLPERRVRALHRMRELLTNGVRSEDWDLRPDVERVIAENRELAGLAEALASVISNWSSEDSLETYDLWRTA